MAFEKGKSGNPGGRPKAKPFRDALNMELAAIGEDHKALRAMAKKLIDRGMKGDLAAINVVADRLDGKPAQAIENAEGEAFNVVSRIERVIVRAENASSEAPTE
ncbi:DUF5681 domain-containing protein [Bradyrhizobium uaiense]|uniref:DUF5681 domain-containing protein n=1 Tax=Bradyrhizobium uaiense TaxID=2594946 RepID=UPI001F31842F|nr:DUF5681 domain-containing protein [Bradyrhizobium uaiense]